MAATAAIPTYIEVVPALLQRKSQLEGTKCPRLPDDSFPSCLGTAVLDGGQVELKGGFFKGEGFYPCAGFGHDRTIGGGTKGVNSLYWGHETFRTDNLS
ncbi:hypothetical protein SDC9_77767 [bioreactor metagenome]|uniref:Uncharacterized protein n=1 Tax=bioreactor metagenome TaxID=1076179 RepID=A0A644YXL2_9ZZZZ